MGRVLARFGHFSRLLSKAKPILEGEPVPRHLRYLEEAPSCQELNENEASLPVRVQFLSLNLGAAWRQHRL